MAKPPSWRWLLTAVPLLLHPLVDASPRLRPACTPHLTPAASSLAHRHGCEKTTHHFWVALRGCQGYTTLLASPEAAGEAMSDGVNSSKQEDVLVEDQERLQGERELNGESANVGRELDGGGSSLTREQEEGVVEEGVSFERSNVSREQGVAAVVDWLKLTDRELQVQCRVETLRSSGPGGQHRNKTESAVRLLHLPTGLVAFAAEDRSQHRNRTKAFKRLREVIALEVRRPVELEGYKAPPDLMRILPKASKKREGGQTIGPNHNDFVQGVQPLLDLLGATKGSISECAAILGLSTGALSRLLVSNRVLWKGVNNLRASYNLKPIRGD